MAEHRPTLSSAERGVAPESSSFDELGVATRLIESLADQGITSPFPIQAATIRDAIAGRDVLGRGRTGSGKTLAFVLPLLTRMISDRSAKGRRHPRALILAPTRELANQIRDVLDPLARATNLRHATVYGGVGYGGQISALRNGVDIIVACPGRLVDLLDSGHADLRSIETTVIDEADHMADLGFLKDVREILDSTPEDAQRLLFSATLDRGVDAIVRDYLHDPVVHEVDEENIPAVDMDHHVLHVEMPDKVAVIADLCAAPGRAVVFTRTKHGATRLTQQLIKAGVPSVELHGNLSQSARARNLATFSSGRAETLVATDVAARGIHVDDVALVIHADPPEDHKTFLHRSGRTARAGATGTVVTLMTPQQRRAVRRLVSDAGVDVTTTKVDPTHPLLSEIAPGDRTFREMPAEEPRSRPQRGSGGPGGGRGPRRNGPGGNGPRGRNDRDRDRDRDRDYSRDRDGDSREGDSRRGGPRPTGSGNRPPARKGHRKGTSAPRGPSGENSRDRRTEGTGGRSDRRGGAPSGRRSDRDRPARHR